MDSRDSSHLLSSYNSFCNRPTDWHHLIASNNCICWCSHSILSFFLSFLISKNSWKVSKKREEKEREKKKRRRSRYARALAVWVDVCAAATRLQALNERKEEERRREKTTTTTTRLNLARVERGDEEKRRRNTHKNDGDESETSDELYDDSQGEASKDGREDVSETKG